MWSNIKDIEVEKVDGTLPYRAKMIRRGGGFVYAGGSGLSEVIITLFSVAGFGRFTPGELAKILIDKFRDRLTHPTWRMIVQDLLFKKDVV